VAASPLFNSLTVALVAEVVADTSRRLEQPSYAEASIGAFVAAHPDAARFVALKLSRGGAAEEAMHALFHAELIVECLRRAGGGREPASVDFARLDAVAGPAPLETLTDLAPALAAYLRENAGELAAPVVAHVALALLP